MKFKLILFLFSLILLTPLISANTFGYNYLDNAVTGTQIINGTNYSINVNNTEHLQGRDTSTLYTYFKGFFDSVYYPFSNPYGFYNSTTLPPQTDYDNSTIARIGSCPEGQVVQNTTNLGVQCVEVSGGDVNLTGYALLNGSNQPFTAPISVSYATGDGVTPVKMILNSTTDGSWTIGSIFAEYDMHSSDTSGGGAGVRTAIKGVVETALGQQNGIALWTTSNGPGALSEKMRISGTGNVRIGAGIPSVDFEINKNGGADARYTRGSTSYRSTFQFYTGTSQDFMIGTQPSSSDLFFIRGLTSAPYSQTILQMSKSTGHIYLPIVNQRLYFNNSAYITYDGTNMIFNTSAQGSGLAYFSNNVSATGFITRTETFDKSSGSALSLIKDSNELKDADGNINHSAFYGHVEYEITDYSKPVNVIQQIEICEVPIIEVPIIVEECSLKQDSKGPYNKICYNKTEMQNVSKTILNTTCDYFEVSKDKFQYICYESEIPSVECRNESYIETTYPFKKNESGVNIVSEIELLRQGIVELKEQNIFLQEQINNLIGKDILITDANTKQDEAICTIKIFDWCLK